MGRPLKPPDGNAPIRVTRVEDTPHAGRMTRASLWLANVAIPKLIPDRVTGPLREWASDADDRLERTARRLMRRQVGRRSKDPDRQIR